MRSLLFTLLFAASLAGQMACAQSTSPLNEKNNMLHNTPCHEGEILGDANLSEHLNEGASCALQ